MLLTKVSWQYNIGQEVAELHIYIKTHFSFLSIPIAGTKQLCASARLDYAPEAGTSYLLLRPAYASACRRL